MGFFKKLLINYSKNQEKKFETSLKLLINDEKKDLTEYGSILKQKIQAVEQIISNSVSKKTPGINWIKNNLYNAIIKQKDIISDLISEIAAQREINNVIIKQLEKELKTLNYPNLTVDYLMKRSSNFTENISKQLGPICDELRKKADSIYNALVEEEKILEKVVATQQIAQEEILQLKETFQNEKVLLEEYLALEKRIPFEQIVQNTLLNISKIENDATEKELQDLKSEISTVIETISNFSNMPETKKFLESMQKLATNDFSVNGSLPSDQEFKSQIEEEISTYWKQCPVRLNPKTYMMKDIDLNSMLNKFEEKITNIIFMTKDVQQEIEKSITQIKEIIKHRDLDNEIKSEVNNISEWRNKYVVGFCEAYKKDDQKKMYECAIQLEKHFTYCKKITMDDTFLIHGVGYTKADPKIGWLAYKHKTDQESKISIEEYAERVCNIVNGGFRGTIRDQWPSTVNHRALFFFNASENPDSFYGPIDIVFNTKGKYLLFVIQPTAGDFDEYCIFREPDNLLKEDFEIYVNMNKVEQHFDRSASKKVFFLLRKMLNNKSVKIFIGNFKDKELFDEKRYPDFPKE